jgi:hypothetical protein
MPGADGRVSERECPACGCAVALGDHLPSSQDLRCSCGQTLKVPRVVTVSQGLPLAKRLEEARRQVAAVDVAAGTRQSQSTAEGPPEAGAEPPVAPRQSTPSSAPRRTKTPAASGPSTAPHEQTGPPSPAARKTTGVMPGPRPSRSATPPEVPPQSPSDLVFSPPVPAGSVAAVAATAPPALPAAAVPPALPAAGTVQVPPPLPVSSIPVTERSLAPSGLGVPPPVPSALDLPPAVPGALVRRMSRSSRAWVWTTVAGIGFVALVVAAFFMSGVSGNSAAKQIGLSAEWTTGTEQSMYGATDTLEVRLSVKNRSAKPVLIQPTADELFVSPVTSNRDGNGSAPASGPKPSYWERLAAQGMEEALGGMESAMPKNAFRIQIAVGNEQRWDPVSPMYLRQDSAGESADASAEPVFDMYAGEGWTIPGNGTLQLVLRVGVRPRGQPDGFRATAGTKPGEVPAAVRIRAVRAPANDRLPELTERVPEDIRQSWSSAS